MGDRRAPEPLKKFARATLGIFIGLVLLEAMLRLVVTVQLPPLPVIPHDVLSGPLIESREIDEGVQTSHYTPGASRWTGAEPVAGAPVIAIIGDSYVVARAVADEETMGAWVERLSREDGVPLNARQYGWQGARPAQYIYVAHQVIDRWSPTRVVVVLSDNDFDSRALTDTIIPPPPVSGLLEHSSLVMVVRHRTALLRFRAQHTLGRWRARLGLPPASPVNDTPAAVEARAMEDSAVAGAVTAKPSTPFGLEAAVVRDLSRAYGPRLAIVFVANTFFAREATEDHVLAACATQRVQCVSTREPMNSLRRRGILTRGFSTTKLGNGHLNADGHEMIGRLIWSMVRDTNHTR